MKSKLTAIVLSAFVALPAAAQGIYRCGSSYSQQPCPGGTQVEAAAAPTTREQARAVSQARQDARRADAMESARLKEEAKPVARYIPPPKKEAASQPQSPQGLTSRKAKKPDYFTAVEPGEREPKNK